MASKLKAGSMELEAAFIEWLRAEGYNPAEGVEAFFSRSEFVRTQRLLLDESEREQVTEEARRFLQQRSSDRIFAGQFPQVHACADHQGATMRYTVMLTLADEGATWTGRAWRGSDYIGEIHGSGSGPQPNYLELARMHIEDQLKQPDVGLRSQD
ncbi:MAG: hypothetical protein ABI858_00645 [Pseudoxanthomonas sp.]